MRYATVLYKGKSQFVVSFSDVLVIATGNYVQP